jgi:hypothetical protein
MPIAGDDHRREASECRPIRGEVPQDRGDEAARSAPDGKTHEETDAALREACRQDHDRHRSNHGADHAERGFAQRSA